MRLPESFSQTQITAEKKQQNALCLSSYKGNKKITHRPLKPNIKNIQVHFNLLSYNG
jgi:hypothetical protein